MISSKRYAHNPRHRRLGIASPSGTSPAQEPTNCISAAPVLCGVPNRNRAPESGRVVIAWLRPGLGGCGGGGLRGRGSEGEKGPRATNVVTTSARRTDTTTPRRRRIGFCEMRTALPAPSSLPHCQSTLGPLCCVTEWKGTTAWRGRESSCRRTRKWPSSSGIKGGRPAFSSTRASDPRSRRCFKGGMERQVRYRRQPGRPLRRGRLRVRAPRRPDSADA